MKKCEGFTLIELLVSLLLLSNIIIITIPMYNRLMATRESFQEERIALELLNECTHDYYETGEIKSGIMKRGNTTYEIKWEREGGYAIVSAHWVNRIGQKREEVYYGKVE